MRRRDLLPAILAAAIAVFVTNCVFANSGVPGVPYTEHFDTTAGWSTTAPVGVGMTPTPPTLVPSGGADGSYVSNTLSLTGQPDLPPAMGGPIPVVLFRAQDVFGSSGDKFENNWITGGLNQLSVYVRHNAPVPLTYFARFVLGSGGNGVNFVAAPPVAATSNWTKLTFDIVPSGPLFVPEGPPTLFDSVMSDVGRLQIGFRLPTGFGADPNSYTYDMDLVSWNTPEPTTGFLAVIGGIIALMGRRSRRAK